MRQCCTDHKGNSKQKYQTKEEAEKAAARRNDEGIAIIVYPCEEGEGWHLTSQNAPPPERPKNVMTQEERKLYTKQNRRRNRNQMGALFDGVLVAQMKDEARKNTIPILEKKIEPLQQEFNEKHRSYWKVHRQLTQSNNEDRAILQETLDIEKQELMTARQKLRAAKHELSSAKRRIKKEN